jgi:hypothetical protein
MNRLTGLQYNVKNVQDTDLADFRPEKRALPFLSEFGNMLVLIHRFFSSRRHPLI